MWRGGTKTILICLFFRIGTGCFFHKSKELPNTGLMSLILPTHAKDIHSLVLQTKKPQQSNEFFNLNLGTLFLKIGFFF
jgi:hypothetical protein